LLTLRVEDQQLYGWQWVVTDAHTCRQNAGV